MTVIRSLHDDQTELLRSIRDLHCPEGFFCDITYGNGSFYRNLPEPLMKYDIEPQAEGVVRACSTMLPIETASIPNIVFDPPFLTYVRDGRSGNGNMALAKRFSGYWKYEELEDHYLHTISEMNRVLRPKGVAVVKCQDIIHNHRMHATHVNVIRWGEQEGFRLKDVFILGAAHRMPSPNRRGKQKHARIFHSYFLVLEKTA